MKKLIPVLFSLFMLTSCEVEFSPNASWKEIPVVYCLLDQDDDTTWARVERCYLGEGSIYGYSSVSDSINYPKGSIEVKLLKIYNGETVAEYTFLDTTVNRQGGNFASVEQPMYFLPGKAHFDEFCTYDIQVRRIADGQVIARSKQPIQLIVRNPEDCVFTKPTFTTYPRKTGMFAFKASGNTCQMEWPALKNARLYQPFVRLYFMENGERRYIDVRTPSVSSTNNTDRYTIFYQASGFLTSVKEQLEDDPAPKTYLKEVDLYLTACSEDLSAYMANIADAGNLDQSRELYSNIEGGRGIFAARRTKLHRWYPADSSLASTPVGLYYQLKQLGVGF